MPHPLARLAFTLAASLVLACGGQTTSTSSDPSGDAGANAGGSRATPPPSGAAGAPVGAAGAPVGAAGAAGTAGASPIAGPTWTAPPSPSAVVCSGRSDTIAMRTSGVRTCSTVVRLDYQTLAPLGYGPICDAYQAADETSAREKAQGYMLGTAGPTVMVTEPGARDLFVFRRESSSERRAVAINARNGGLVFISITGNYTPYGDMSFPLVFFEGDELGLGCLANTPRPPARGFDLINGGSLASDRVQAAIDAVWHTAVPDGLTQGGYVFDAMVLLTPPDYEGFDAARARYTVIVNSGWLE